MSWGYQWRPYVPVHKRRANATAYAAKLAKKENRALAPISLNGRTIAASFWGKSWCENLESYSDYENRLPRGRTYVRNGSVIDLQIERGQIRAIVAGSEVYRVKIDIKTVPAAVWTRIKKDCSRSVESLLDLLQGKFDHAVMQRLTLRDGGLFPQPREIKMSCSCPDWAGMCKHVAAVLYGVGARLDAQPELLFTLRDVDHFELISQAATADNLEQALTGKSDGAFQGSDLGEIFGIELESAGAKAEPSDGAPSTATAALMRPASKRRGAAANPKKKGVTPKPSSKAEKPRTITVARRLSESSKKVSAAKKASKKLVGV